MYMIGPFLGYEHENILLKIQKNILHAKNAIQLLYRFIALVVTWSKLSL